LLFQTTIVRAFQGFVDRGGSCHACEVVPESVGRRRDASRVPQVCPECVRVFNAQATTKCRFAGTLCKPSGGLEPPTPSLPWRFRGVTRVHARSLATQFFLQIDLIRLRTMRREASRVSFLMCPFCVRGRVPVETTPQREPETARGLRRVRRRGSAAVAAWQCEPTKKGGRARTGPSLMPFVRPRDAYPSDPVSFSRVVT
jgi:hypothetical protein